jgi:TPR repeat protein
MLGCAVFQYTFSRRRYCEVHGMWNLADGLEAFHSSNYDRALAILLPIATAGDPEAQCLIGNLYHSGLGLDQNIPLAMEWYEKSANQGYGVAANNLSEIFFAGQHDGFPNLEKAEFWRKTAIAQGFLHTRHISPQK